MSYFEKCDRRRFLFTYSTYILKRNRMNDCRSDRKNSCTFEEYCSCDDYYEPVVEDFELEDYVKKWADKNRFIVVSCKGDGRDNGYEPKFRRYW